MSRLIVASLGTDQHPFPRLVRWLDALAAQNPQDRFVVQHGYTEAPLRATGHDFLPHEQLIQLVQAADIAVCHGGPGTLMDAQRAGHRPVVVPRDPQFGEHVDGHQQRFAAVVAKAGRADVATDRASFERIIGLRLRNLTEVRVSGGLVPTNPPDGLQALAHELLRLPVHPVRRAPLLRSVRRKVAL